MENKLDRRQLVKLGVIAGGALGLLSMIYRPSFEKDTYKGNYQFTYLSSDARKIILSLTEILVGIPKEQLTGEQKNSILITIDQLVGKLNPDIQKDVLNLFVLFNFPAFRWYLGLFNQYWHEASHHEVMRAIEKLKQTQITLFHIAFQNLQRLVSSAYYSQDFSWESIGFPGFIDFVELAHDSESMEQ